MSPDLNDTWALTLSPTLEWNQIVTSNPPPTRHAAALFVDPAGGQLWLQGGVSVNTPREDIWRLPLAGGAWTMHAFQSPQPTLGAFVTDTARNRFVLQGGVRPGQTPRPLDDTWVLDPAALTPAFASMASRRSAARPTSSRSPSRNSSTS